MRVHSRLTWGFFVFFLTTAAHSAAPPLEVYGRLPTIEDVALSPDGSRVAFVKTEGDSRSVYVYSLVEKRVLRIFNGGDQKLRDAMWGDDDHLLLVFSAARTVSNDKYEFSVLQSCNLVDGACVNPLSVKNAYALTNTIGAEPTIRKINGETWVYIEGLAYGRGRALFRYRLSDGILMLAEVNGLGSWGLLDKNGRLLTHTAYSERMHRWGLSLVIDGKAKRVLDLAADIDRPVVAGIDPNGDSLWLHLLEDDRPVWRIVALQDGKISAPLTQAEVYDSVITDSYTGVIIGGRKFVGDETEFFDNRLYEAWRIIVNFYSTQRVRFISATPDFRKILVTVEGASHGYIYSVFDTQTFQFQSLGKIYEALTQLAEAKPIKYVASDGLEIPGYLTLPTTGKTQGLPLVVLPHGGPAVRDTGDFDWMAQAFASQGYAVLQPNFRGSDLGWQFMSAGFGEWGGKMQSDLSDGVRYLVKMGTVDSSRVCIIGASYGGYAALAGAAFENTYRCAVSINGISDLKKYQSRIIKRTDRLSSAFGRYFYRYVGASDFSDPIIKLRSPALNVEKIDAPILLIHGLDDTVVPSEQSQQMADSLRRAKKKFEFVTLKDEDHWLSRSATRLQTLQETVRFLKQYNPPD